MSVQHDAVVSTHSVPPPPRTTLSSASMPPSKVRGSLGRTGFFGAFVHAYEGLLHACSQRNMKFHVVSAVLVGLVGSGIRLGLAEKVTLIFCVMLVFFAEILNTALEALVDLHTEDYRDLAKTTKDAAAAGVLVLALGTVVIFAALLVHNWDVIASSGAQIARQAGVGVPFATITGLLLARWPRPAWVDHLLFTAGVVLWFVLWQFTVSWVFTTLTGSLMVLAWRASQNMRRSAP